MIAEPIHLPAIPGLRGTYWRSLQIDECLAGYRRNFWKSWRSPVPFRPYVDGQATPEHKYNFGRDE